MSVSLDNELSDYGRSHQNVETETAEKDMNTETVQVYERGTGTCNFIFYHRVRYSEGVYIHCNLILTWSNFYPLQSCSCHLVHK